MAEVITVGVREFRANLSRYLREVEAGGEVAIVSRGRVRAELRRPAIDKPVRGPVFGSLKDTLWMADDWDSWTEEELAAFESPIDPERLIEE